MKRFLLGAVAAAVAVIGSPLAFAQSHRSQEMPSFDFPLGTSRNTVLFNEGNPTDQTPCCAIYDSYGFHAYEETVFVFDQSQKLEAIAVTASPDVQTANIPLADFVGRIYRFYLTVYGNTFGKPTLSKKDGDLWVYRNGIAQFTPVVNRVGSYDFKLLVMSREAAANAGYSALWDASVPRGGGKQ